MFGFTNDQIYRYSRHIILPDIGGAGQKKIVERKSFARRRGRLGIAGGDVSCRGRRRHAGAGGF